MHAGGRGFFGHLCGLHPLRSVECGLVTRRASGAPSAGINDPAAIDLAMCGSDAGLRHRDGGSSIMRPAIHPFEPLRSIWRYRDLVVQMTERDAQARYRGSSAGVLWTVFHPLLMLAVYTFFFTEVFPTRWTPSGDGRMAFALTLFVGLLLHGFLAEVLSRSPTLIVANQNLVKKVVFPLDLLPVVATASALFHFAIGIAVWLAFHAVVNGLPPATALWLPVVVAPLILMTLGLAWLLASLGVYLRDVAQVVPVVTSVLLFASPIFYPLAALKGGFRTLVLASPLTVPIEQARRVMIDGRPPDFGALAAYSLVALAVAYLGFVWFQGTRKGFADVV
jgi:lipopolysaccharide transport system permease protein